MQVKSLNVALILLLCVMPSLKAAAADVDNTVSQETGSTPLPDLGDRANLILPKARARRLGLQFMAQLRQRETVLTDPEILHYLESLGKRILPHVPAQGLNITINMVQRDQLNAFAVPGGFIVFNTGLILATQSEGELASVMSHEIAHVSQRHLARLLAANEESKLPTTAAILASIILGGQAGLAGLTVTNAQLISNQLRFTRGFEREADAIGIDILAASGFDVREMPSFFRRLEAQSLEQAGGAPEYLRTHPLSYKRVADAESRVKKYHAAAIDRPPSSAFLHIQAKIRALYSERSKSLINYFAADEEPNDTPVDELHDRVRRYGLALSNMRLGNWQAAEILLDELREQYPDFLPYQIAAGELAYRAGDYSQAVSYYELARDTFPNIQFSSIYLAEALLADGDATTARQIIRRSIRRRKGRLSYYLILSRANAALGRLGEAEAARAEYDAGTGNKTAAVAALERALNDRSLDHVSKKRIEARLDQLQGNKLR